MAEKHAISRREFNKRVAISAAAAVCVPGSILDAAPPEAFPLGTYVDFHTQLGQVWGNRPPLSAGALVHWMNENDISQAVVHSVESPEGWDHPLSTGFVLEETETYRHRLIPAAYVDPRVIDLWLSTRDNVAPLIRRYVAAGARVFGEHNPGIPIADPLNMELYRSVTEAGALPIFFHMDNLINADEPGLPGLEKVLRAYPDIAFVGHAEGFWASLSGDATQAQFDALPDTRVTPGGALIRLMETYPNLYGDLGGESGANAIARDLDHGREFVIRFADRLVWSSDYYMPGRQVRQFELFDRLDLPEEVQQKVYRDNARRIIGLI